MTGDKKYMEEKYIEEFDEIVKSKEKLETVLFIYACKSFFIGGFVLGIVIGTG